MAVKKKSVKKTTATKKTTSKRGSSKSRVAVKSVKASAKKTKVEVPVPKHNIDTGNIVGTWAFVLGFIIAIVAGFAEFIPMVNFTDLQFLLILAGVIVGFLNVKDHEATTFLLAGLSLVLVSWLGAQTVSQVQIYSNMLNALQTLFVPATIIVALRSLFVISHK